MNDMETQGISQWALLEMNLEKYNFPLSRERDAWVILQDGHLPLQSTS
jgi:hypothetical protein